MGLSPSRAARLRELVDECRPLLASEGGMAAVQRLLSEHHVAVIDAVLVTRELLGAGPEALRNAKMTVLTSPSRSRELKVHDDLVEELEGVAVSIAADDDPRQRS